MDRIDFEITGLEAGEGNTVSSGRPRGEVVRPVRQLCDPSVGQGQYAQSALRVLSLVRIADAIDEPRAVGRKTRKVIMAGIVRHDSEMRTIGVHDHDLPH